MKNLILLLLFTTPLLGQWSAGVSTGIQSNHLIVKGNAEQLNDFTSTHINGFIGLSAGYQANDNVSIRSGIRYAPTHLSLSYDRSVTIGGLDLPVGAEMIYKSKNIAIPVEVEYAFYKSGAISLHANMGAQLAYNIDDDIHPYISSPLRIALPKIAVNNTRKLNTFASAGVGANYTTATGIWRINVGYQRTLQTMLPDQIIDINAKSHGITAGIGYEIKL